MVSLRVTRRRISLDEQLVADAFSQRMQAFKRGVLRCVAINIPIPDTTRDEVCGIRRDSDLRAGRKFFVLVRHDPVANLFRTGQHACGCRAWARCSA